MSPRRAGIGRLIDATVAARGAFIVHAQVTSVSVNRPYVRNVIRNNYGGDGIHLPGGASVRGEGISAAIIRKATYYAERNSPTNIGVSGLDVGKISFESEVYILLSPLRAGCESS